MKLGYVRVSTEDQHLERQIDSLVLQGIDRRNIYREKFTGTTLARPVLRHLLDELQAGDEVYVTDLSRISRSRADLLDLVEWIGRKGARLISISDSWFRMDSEDAYSKFIFDFVTSLNEFQRNLISQLTRDGQAAARERGRFPGRPQGTNAEILRKIPVIEQLIAEQKYTVGAACKLVGVSRSTYYRIVNQQDPPVSI